ncbi:transcription factor bHLH149-like [Nymphaea colorata]|uniref:IBH1-like N-terminal domain-containing protein n=1 Tax=Nymphaea colorata TaxID=210225 RepID=A0A5K0XQK8_9MAGN|nr:transcription factor bHLH149-like [Nymphaea colorata]
MTPESPSADAPPKPGEGEMDVDGQEEASAGSSRWRTGSEQRSYTGRLLRALRSAGRSAASPPGVSPSLIVKEAADSALAITARGQSRWSRAILARWRRRRGKFQWRRLREVSARRRAAKMEPSPSKPEIRRKRKRGQGGGGGAAVGSRLMTLGRLIPGGRKLAAPTLIEEATDYIAALEMQVKVMSALADLLSAAARC